MAQRHARLKAVCRFTRYVRAEDTRHECRRPITSARKKRRPPHIYSAEEIDRLIEAALRLRPKGGLRSTTYATLIAPLSATGLRISEALKLTIADVTNDGLLIRETKFRKTRPVPLHDTAAAGLKRYLARHRPRSDDDPVFIDERGLPLRYIAVKETFDRMVSRAGIRPASNRRPRLHDLRHTFAVRALQAARQAETGVGRIWWRSRHTWATSTSTRPTVPGGHRGPHARCRRGWGRVHVRGEATMTPIAPLIETFLCETLVRQRDEVHSILHAHVIPKCPHADLSTSAAGRGWPLNSC